MEFFRIKRDIPFMSYGKLTTAISLITFICHQRLELLG